MEQKELEEAKKKKAARERTEKSTRDYLAKQKKDRDKRAIVNEKKRKDKIKAQRAERGQSL